MDAPDDDMVTILRRAPVLAVCHDRPRSRQELVERTHFSRSTAYRATVALEERGLLENAGDGYRTTRYGAAVLAAAESYGDAIETIDRLEPLLDLVDSPELATHAHLFRDPEVTVADASNPYEVVNRVVERFERTATSHGTIASTTHLEAVEQTAPDLSGKESIERIFARTALETHSTVADETLIGVAATDTVSIYVADDDEIPFTFAIDENEVTLVGHDPATGLPTVHVESARPEARAWLERVYERCRGNATPI